MIRTGRGHLAHMPVRVMIQEHDRLRRELGADPRAGARVRAARVRLHKLAFAVRRPARPRAGADGAHPSGEQRALPRGAERAERLAGVGIDGDRVKIGRSLFDESGETMTIERHSVARSKLGLAFSVVRRVCCRFSSERSAASASGASDTARRRLRHGRRRSHGRLRRACRAAAHAGAVGERQEVFAGPRLLPRRQPRGRRACAPSLIRIRATSPRASSVSRRLQAAIADRSGSVRTVSLGPHATGMPPGSTCSTTRIAGRGAVRQDAAPAYEDDRTGRRWTSDGSRGTYAGTCLARQAALRRCWLCELPRAEGYGDGQSADTLKDAFGSPIQPRNFHKAAEFKRGHTLRDIALTISTGNNGTPMPSFGMSWSRSNCGISPPMS